MTEEQYKQMLDDREHGTRGGFTFNGVRMVRADGKALAVIVTPHGNTTSDEADGRRIARVPDMEAEIIRLREALESIASYCEPCPSMSDIEVLDLMAKTARATLKGETAE